MTRFRVGTFDVLTRLNVAAAACVVLGALVTVGCWRAGVHPYAAVGVGTLAGACAAVVSELRRGAAGRPRAIAGLYLGWAILLGPLAWLAAALVWSLGGV